MAPAININTIHMKHLHWLQHPLAQLITFSMLLVGSPDFGGPYIFFVWHAFFAGQPFGIIGIFAIFITLVSLFPFPFRAWMQLGGWLLMMLSLTIFLISGHGKNMAAWHQAVPLFTLIAFALISILVCRKIFSRFPSR